MTSLLLYLVAIGLTYLGGKLIQEINFPAILGWLLAGILVGPHVLNILRPEVLHSDWNGVLVVFSQVIVGVMVGSNLIVKDIRAKGADVVKVTLTNILGILLVVTAGFAVLFYLQAIPLLFAFILGMIAIATAPAPVISVVNEYNTEGPLTDASIQMTVLKSVLVSLFFFSFISILGAMVSDASSSLVVSLIQMMVVPILIGLSSGYVANLLIDESTPVAKGHAIFVAFLVIQTILLLLMDHYLYASPQTNYILAGIGYAASFVNIVEKEHRDPIFDAFSLIQSAGLLLMILNVTAPLNPASLLDAGLLSLLYVGLRALGSVIGGYLGGQFSGMSPVVKKYIGVTMLPHSGTSIVNAGIAAATMAVAFPEASALILAIVPAAAIVNEILAILATKKAFEAAGEVGVGHDDEAVLEEASYKYTPTEDRYFQNKRHPRQRYEGKFNKLILKGQYLD